MAELTSEILDAPRSVEPETPPGRWDIASVASLACGIFLIVPFFAGLAAVALAIIGIRQINESNQNLHGRRLAVAGLILGLLNILGWSAYFKFIGEISGPGRTVAHRFIDDLNSANLAGAARECLANVRPDRLDTASDQIKSWGGVKSVAVLYVTSDTANGITTGSVRGTLRTPTGEHAFQLQTACEDGPEWKIKDFSLQ
jgi:Domain of unknown function (DUF4190)